MGIAKDVQVVKFLNAVKVNLRPQEGFCGDMNKYKLAAIKLNAQAIKELRF